MERLGSAPKAKEVRPSEPPANVHQYGLDAAGRVAVARSFDGFGNPTEEFFFPDGAGDWSVRYETLGDQVRPAALAQEERVDGTLVGYHVFRGPSGWEHERYERDGAGRIVRIERDLPGEAPERFDVAYGPGDLVAEIRDEGGRPVFRAGPPKPAALARRAEDELVAAISAALGRLPLQPGGVLLIGYDYEAPLDPVLAVSGGLDAAGSDDPLEAFSPWDRDARLRVAEAVPKLRLSTLDLAAFFRAADDDELLRGVMVKVARRLAKQDPAKGLDLTVLPVDADLEHLERNASQVLQRAELRRLTQALSGP